MNRNVEGLKPGLLIFHLFQFLFHHAVPWISFSVAILTLLRVWKKMLPAVSVNKGCCSHQPITFQPRWQWALRELKVETGCPPSSHQPLQPPLTVHPEDAEDGETPDLGPDRCTEISEPRLLHLPKQREAWNSLTWDTWLSVINSNLLNSDYQVFFFLQNLLYSLAPPFPF